MSPRISIFTRLAKKWRCHAALPRTLMHRRLLVQEEEEEEAIEILAKSPPGGGRGGRLLCDGGSRGKRAITWESHHKRNLFINPIPWFLLRTPQPETWPADNREINFFYLADARKLLNRFFQEEETAVKVVANCFVFFHAYRLA